MSLSTSLLVVRAWVRDGFQAPSPTGEVLLVPGAPSTADVALCTQPSRPLFFFFFRKISPELTAANPPLFAEEDWP